MPIPAWRPAPTAQPLCGELALLVGLETVCTAGAFTCLPSTHACRASLRGAQAPPVLRHRYHPPIHPPTPQVHNNFGGGFVSDEDKVALSAIKFASAESAGAKCISGGDGHSNWLEASMEQLCVPLPPWSLRAGARETIWFNPAEVNAASECCNGCWEGLQTGCSAVPACDGRTR